MIRTGPGMAAICLLASSPAGQEPYRPPVVGRWDLTLTASDGCVRPSGLEVQVSANHVLVVRFGAVVGSARPIARLDFARDTLRFAIPSQWESGTGDPRLEGGVGGEGLAGSVTRAR